MLSASLNKTFLSLSLYSVAITEAVCCFWRSCLETLCHEIDRKGYWLTLTETDATAGSWRQTNRHTHLSHQSVARSVVLTGIGFYLMDT